MGEDELRIFREYLKNNSENVDSLMLKGLLSDFVKENKKKNVLGICIEARVVDRLRVIDQDSFEEKRLASKLENDYDLKPESALWAIKAWSYILGRSDEEPKDIPPQLRPIPITYPKREMNIMGFRFTKQDLAKAVVLVALGFFSIFSYSIFHSNYGHIPFLNVDNKLIYLTLILGFAIGLGFGNMMSGEVRLRIFGVFLLATSIFAFIRWTALFDAYLLELGVGLILSILLSLYTSYVRRYLWVKIADGFVIGIIAIEYLLYLVLLSNNAALDFIGFIAGFVSFFIFPIIGYAVLKGEKEEV